MKRQTLGLKLYVFLAAAVVVGGQTPADPPSRVARLSFLEGSVSYRPASIDEWAPAALNSPLTAGDRLWTAENSFAEVHVGPSAIHLPPQTAFGVSYLDDKLAQVSLSQGTLFIRVPILAEGESFEVDTPNGAVSLVQTGSYRIFVDVDNNATSITVRSGEADVAGNGRAFQVRPGRMLQLVGIQEVADIQDALAPDAWELSCAASDQQAEQSLEASEAYVSPEMDGAADLAQYGTWSTDAEFGAVWSPGNVDAGWAPYRNGHWAFVPPWGWTWIDDARWGFAPFHFGRWVCADGRWLWLPGRREARPVFSPALVAFVAAGGVRAAAPPRSGPLTAWIPLGPGELYRPPYAASAGYVRRVNAPVVRAANAADGFVTYRNRDQIIVVPRQVVLAARPVGPEAVRMARGAAASVAPVSIADMQPVRESYLGPGAGAASRPPVPPEAVLSRAVVVKHEIPGAVQAAADSRPGATPPATPPVPADAVPVQPELAGGKEQQVQLQVGEQQRVDRQRAQQQGAEQQRANEEQAAQQRADRQRADEQRAAQQHEEQQRAGEQRAAQQRADQERAAQQRADQQRAEQQRAEQERAQQQRADEQRAAQQRADQQRAEQQRAEQQRAAQQRADQERAAQQRADQQRADQQRAEQQRAEQQRAEQQRAEEAKKADDAKKKQ